MSPAAQLLESTHSELAELEVRFDSANPRLRSARAFRACGEAIRLAPRHQQERLIFKQAEPRAGHTEFCPADERTP